MEKLRVGTLNINGGRDRNKRAVVREFLNIKTLTWSFYKRPIVTKKTRQNGDVLVRSTLISAYSVRAGRLLMVQGDIRGTGFLFVNVYASNIGSE